MSHTKHFCSTSDHYGMVIEASIASHLTQCCSLELRMSEGIAFMASENDMRYMYKMS